MVAAMRDYTYDYRRDDAGLAAGAFDDAQDGDTTHERADSSPAKPVSLRLPAGKRFAAPRLAQRDCCAFAAPLLPWHAAGRRRIDAKMLATPISLMMSRRTICWPRRATRAAI